MNPHLAIDRYHKLKARGLATFEIIRLLRLEFSISIGQAKEIMVNHYTGQCLKDHQETLLEPLIRAFEDSDHPEPKFELDDVVKTVGDQHTVRVGCIRDRVWHHKDEEWHFYISVEGKKIPTRYLAADLQRTNRSEQEFDPDA